MARKARPSIGPPEHEVEPDDDEDRRGEGEERHNPDIDRAEGQGGGLERARADPPAVGGEHLEQRILDDDREPEGDEERRQDVLAEGAVEDDELERPAECEHDRDSDEQRQERTDAERRDDHQDEVGCEHDQVAMGEVDQPHDAEDEAEARGEERVEAAEQHALHDRVEPVHARHPEIGGMDVLAAQLGRRARKRDAPLHHAIDPVRDLERLADILLDDDQRRPRRADAREGGVDVADHDRREPEAQLVAEEHAGIGHQRATDRDHLLLAARERRARTAPPLAEDGEQRVDRIEAPRSRPLLVGADDEVLLDAERGEEPPPLRHHRDSEIDDRRRGQRADGPAVEADGVGRVPYDAGDGAEQRRLAGAVGADDRHRLARLEHHVDAEQRLEIAVAGRQAPGLEEGHQTSIPR